MEHYKVKSEMLEAIRFANENSSEELFLSQLDLANLDDQIGKLKEVTSIYLFGNNFNEFPSQLCQMTQLERIYISGNNIKSLPEDIGNLKELCLLDIKNNQLSEIPVSFGKLTKLETLYLSDNSFESFPFEILHCTKLKKLDIKGNLIRKIPEEIARLIHLTQLDLSKNQLTTLPEGIGSLVGLKKLHAVSNMITELPPSLVNLVNLNSNNQKYDWERGLGLDENPILSNPEDANLEPITLINKLTEKTEYTSVQPKPIEKIIKVPEALIDKEIEAETNEIETKETILPVGDTKEDDFIAREELKWRKNEPIQRREELVRFNIFGSNETIAEELIQDTFHIDNEHGILRFKINGQFVEFGINRFADIPLDEIGNQFFRIPNGINFIIVSKFKELKQLTKVTSPKRTIAVVRGKIPKNHLFDFPILSFKDPVKFEIELASNLAYLVVKLKNKLLREDLGILNELLTSTQKFAINKDDFDQYAEPAGLSSKLEHGFARKYLSKKGYIYHEPKRLYLSKKIVLNKSKLFNALYLLNNSIYLVKQRGVIEEKYFDKIFGTKFDEEIHLFLFEVMLHEGWCERIPNDKLSFKWFVRESDMAIEPKPVLEPSTDLTPNQPSQEEREILKIDNHNKELSTSTMPYNQEMLWDKAKWFMFWSLLLLLFTFSGFLIAMLFFAY